MKTIFQSKFRGCRAFTMVEIAICLAIIGFALVAIIGVLPIGMSVQKDNREETVINFDARYLMDAIRSGSLGQDEMTNFIVGITNVWTTYDATKSPFQVKQSGIDFFNSYTNANGAYYSVGNVSPPEAQFLTNGLNIIGLLSTPKYVLEPKIGPGIFRSNFISADIRAITGSPMDQGSGQSSKDFAFAYRVQVEITPFGVYDPSLTNWNTSDPNILIPDRTNRMLYGAYAANLQPNLNDIRLRFRWPLLPQGQLGTGNQTYRGVVGGAARQTNFVTALFYFRSQTYTNGFPIYAGGVPLLP